MENKDNVPAASEPNTPPSPENQTTVAEQKVISGVFWKFGERFFAQLISFVVSVILARLLSPHDYGAVAIILIFINVADVFINSGFSVALVQKEKIADGDYTTVFYTNLAISGVLYVALFFAAPFIAQAYQIDGLDLMIRLIALKLPLSALNSVQIAYVDRSMQFKLFFFATIVGTIISGFVGIYMAFKGCGAYSLIAQQLVNLFFDSLILFITIKWKPKISFSRECLKEIAPFSLKNMATDLVGTAFNQLNSFLVGLKYTTEDLAYYTKGFQIPQLVNSSFSSVFTDVFFPVLSRSSKDIDEIKKILSRATRMITYVMFPIIAGIFIVSKDLILILYTDKWISVVPYLRIACIALMIDCVGMLDITTIKALGKTGLTLKMEIIKKPIFLGIIVGAMFLGIEALAWSTVVVSALALLVNSLMLQRCTHYSLWQKFKDILAPLIYCLMMGLSIWAFNFIGFTNYYLEGLLDVLLGVFVYLLLSIVLKNPEFMTIIWQSKNLMKRVFARHKKTA